MKNKRGQLLAQPFTYIFALVVIAMIVAFGFWIVNKLSNLGNEVNIATFKSDIEKRVAELNNLSPGSGDNLALSNVPVGIKGICFIDTTLPGFDAGQIEFAGVKDYIDSMEGKTDRNVFFAMTTSNYQPIAPVKIGKLRPSPNPLCIDIKQGVLKAGLVNKGRFVEISKA